MCNMPKMVSHKVLAGKSYWQIFRYLFQVHLICKEVTSMCYCDKKTFVYLRKIGC